MSFAAFLSYTRPDDEFFGGGITALRKHLELGVQVVTGDRSFRIFQDVDGIALGEDWNQKLSEAIAGSRFFMPVLTPLYFTSLPCSEELERFRHHEALLGRNDLILPIYFITAPVLERPELLHTDALATLIASRQRFDYRQQTQGQSNDPTNRAILLELASGVAAAMDRTGAQPMRVAEVESSAIDAEVHHFGQAFNEAREVTRDARKLVLWVDDSPDNNIIERKSMAAYDIEFVLATSTEGALSELSRQRFDAVISDMGRPPDSRAGYTLLEAIRRRGYRMPFFIYAGSRKESHVREALARGAQGTTNRGDELLNMLLSALNTASS
ncbi:TIR domain-containing protein [Mycolicibacterium litorale]|uniref:TIR domain-containing protein n=1 Tax=Mycolicibacterium litorale TaxID=758802 RepID=UPI003CF9BB48